MDETRPSGGLILCSKRAHESGVTREANTAGRAPLAGIYVLLHCLRFLSQAGVEEGEQKAAQTKALETDAGAPAVMDAELAAAKEEEAKKEEAA